MNSSNQRTRSMGKTALAKLFLLLLVLLTTQHSRAQFEEGKENTTIYMIKGTALQGINPTVTATYNAYPGEINHRIKNIITFRINEDTSVYMQSNFSATVNFTLSTTSAPTPVARSLTVNFDKADGAKYNVRAYMVLPNEEANVQVVVQSVNITGGVGWNPVPVLQLENEIRILRYYDLATSTPLLTPAFKAAQDSIDRVKVSWNWDIGGGTHNNMNQLEWAYVPDDAAGYYVDAGTMNYDRLFNTNATRIDLDFGQDSFFIPLLYGDTGKLYYRVRPVLRKNDGSMISGPWSSPQSFQFNGHEISLNWQSATSFAENGKLKTVIQYFDGSLRSRQTVTKDNSTGNVVVGETIYDLQGRPNVQILPTPALDPLRPGVIQFFKDFNRFQGMALYEDPAKYFDLAPLNHPCDSIPKLDITKGNGRYYSANNDWLGLEAKSKYIPDAEGYAYTETRFMDDATERVRSQGGVGKKFQINSQDTDGRTHDTRYYYGKPSQQEMDALFGTEVGDASHYSKNMVKDPNGQMSVSYVDMHGRTIATSLAGDTVNGMSSILNPVYYPMASAKITNQLLTPVTNIINGTTIENVSTILSPTTSVYDFTYKLDPGILSQFSCTNQQICFDCKYDLEISIKSEDCGAVPIIRRYNNLQIVPANQACGTSMGFSGEGLTNVKQIDFSQTLGPGAWVVRKTLTINDSMYKVRRDSALKVFLCRSRDSIYAAVYNVLYSTSGCGLPPGSTSACDSCMNHLGSFTLYRFNYLVAIGIDPNTQTPALDITIHSQYTADSMACANACGSLNVELSTLKGLRKQMLQDMMPYTGQYAIPLDSMNASGTGGPDYNRLEAKFNIFSNKYQSVTRTPYFRLPVTESGAASDYFQEDGTIDMNIEPNGDRHIILDTITPNVYSSQFQPSWANSLIYRHPEFSKLQYAETNMQSAYSWLDSVQATDKYAVAHAKGYDNPLFTGLNPDPFFQYQGTAAFKDTMNRRIVDSMIVTATHHYTGNSIWQIANSAAYCDGLDNSLKQGCINSMVRNQMDPAITVDSVKDKVWERFRSLYLSYRNDVVIKYLDTYAGAPLLNSTDKAQLIREKKMIVFANMNDMAMENRLDSAVWVHVSSAPADTTGVGGIGGGGVSGNTDKCEAQRPFWKARLKQCEQLKALLNTETHNDSVTVNTIINSILDGMVSVCHNSITPLQPYGASNVNPLYTGTPQNFEDVINQVFTANGIATLPNNNYFCNPYTIDYPKPFGKNPPLLTNYTNQIDSCNCARFAALKLEAGPDSVDLTHFNNFLKANYNDSLTLPLWTGLQQCRNALRDTCVSVWGPANGASSFSGKGNLATFGANPPANAIGCTTPVVTSATYINTTNFNNIKVKYSTGIGYTSCTLTITNTSGVVVLSQSITCGTDSVTISLPGCNTYNITVSAFSKSCGTKTSLIYILSPLPSCTGCFTPVVNSAAYINTTSTNNVKVTYSTGGSYTSCTLLVYDNGGNLVLAQPVNCGTDSVTVSLPACTLYTIKVSGSSRTCGTIESAPVTLYPLPGCNCVKPIINSVTVIYPNPTPTTQNVSISYLAPQGATNCVLKVYIAGSPTEVYSQTLNCGATSTTLSNMVACNKYRFVIKTDYLPNCVQIASDTARLDSCWHVNCTKYFKPIILPTVVVMPPFMACGYVKPCITCNTLDSLTNAFRALYSTYSGVPYTDTANTTDAQAQQNALWARYLNYKTGFSKNARDYMAAYKNCHTPPNGGTTIALCEFNKPLNDPGGFFEIDTLPCRYVQTQAGFIALMLYQQERDSLVAAFDSAYKSKCLQAKYTEQFYVQYMPKEYHYTLYFYDQAGNLVKTMPPAAVKPNYNAAYLTSVANARNNNNTDVPNPNNNEALATQYRYNGLNQVNTQKTPDAGISNFWYDRLGRLAVSQNAKQVTTNNYSYTLYDVLGRITEVGQSTNLTLMSQTISQDTTALKNWINNTTAGTKKQITLTVYDIPYTSIAVSTPTVSGLYQKNLRNRVSYSMVFDDETQKVPLSDGTIAGGNSASYYSYDIHGNVDTLLQDYKLGMGTIACSGNAGNRFKKLVYNYDLISGKVNEVAYQPGSPDQFYHRYKYDAEVRLTQALTSKDKIYWEREASYDYYRHGTLARTVLGEKQVQGQDYAYTLQGWLKGVNSTSVGTTLSTAGDMGQDGLAGANSLVARDAYGFSLNYYSNDYKPIPITTTYTPFVTVPMSLPADPVSGISTGAQLFNGNIGAMVVNIPKLGNPMVYGYRYDQLNRITRMDAFNGLNNAANTFTPARTNDYHEEVGYDPNGNIRSYLRNGSTATSNQAMDQLNYNYYVDGNGNLTTNNRLRHVTDAVVPHTDDIGTQGVDNYSYDAIGNLTGDAAEGLTITWNVYGKIATVTKAVTGNPTTTIAYTYDAAGNRISKAVTVSGVTKTTYYVRDASGNVMSIYQAGEATVNSGDLTQTELHLYGSSRLGIYNVNVDVQCTVAGNGITIFTRGNKFFELSNHLGNVLATITDKKQQHSSNNTTVDYYLAEVVTANDYYPFGMGMPGRKYTGTIGYRYGFNGKEVDNDIEKNAQDYGMRVYDPRLSRFLTVDPIGKEYPMLTPYQFASNSPIAGIDQDGLEFQYHYIRQTTENGKPKLSVGTFVEAQDHTFEVTMKITATHYVLGIFPVSASVKPSLQFTLGDLGVAPTVVWNKSWLILPDGVDPNNLPALDDPIWGTFETTDEFCDRFVKTGNTIIKAISDIADVVNFLKGNTGSGSDKLGVKKTNLDKPQERAKRLAQLENGRPKYRKGLVEEVWEAAKKKGGGVVRDPKTGQEITWDKFKKRGGQWDMGHKPGKEFKDLKKQYQNGEINWQQLKKEYNNPDNYRPELPSSNRSNNQRG